jgi:hypothetical protein
MKKPAPEPAIYRTPDDRWLGRTAYLAYLKECAKRWEALGAPEEAERARRQAAEIRGEKA